jgi:hypothetical protein
MTIERKYERDIDVLLAEEFDVNPAFAQRFLRLTRFAGEQAQVAEVFVSKSDNLGESDLVVIYITKAERRFALFIEDKVDAPLQPTQAERYRSRADRDQARGLFSEYEVLLCAPAYYIENRVDLHGFDRRLAFEQIAEVIRTPGDARAEYRARFLETAATRRINTWAPEADDATTLFWGRVYDIAKRDFPELEMKPPSPTKAQTWITFRPRDFPTMPKWVRVDVKGDRGFADLTFSGTTAYLFQPAVQGLLDPDMVVHQAGASAVIRIETQTIRPSDDGGEGLPAARAALGAASRLVSLFRRSRAELERAAEAATPWSG